MNPLVINVKFGYKYTVVVNSVHIPTPNLEPQQNVLLKALRLQWNLDILQIVTPGDERAPELIVFWTKKK